MKLSCTANDNLETIIEEAIHDALPDHVEFDNNGIGYFEYSGHQDYDRGTDYAYVDGFTITVDVTDAPNVHDWEDSVTGHETIWRGDEAFQVDWKADFKKQETINGKTYLFFEVK
jgi:hypothetical protein